MEENINLSKIKKEKIKLVVLVVSILMIASSVTYAFFVAGVSDPANTDVNLGTEVSGGLVFTPGTPINLTANLTNFAEGEGSLSGETTSTANLKAASSTGSATENYYIYYNVTSNNFVYTKDNTTPELLLTITDPEGNEITALTNHPELTHKTVTDAVIGNVSGFDVTTYEGLILIDDSYTISTTDSTVGETQEWKAKLTFVNLDTVQTANEGKVFESQLMLRTKSYNIADDTLVKFGYTISEIEEIKVSLQPNFSADATTYEGIFAAEDDYGTSYYYRGAVDDNWVEFAGYYWRIIRINGDGSVRMIYSGPTQPNSTQKVVMTGEETLIGRSPFNSSSNLAEDAGYMYTVGQQHGLTTDSAIKIAIDSWYETNILNTKYHDMISDTLFCADRTAYTDGNGTTEASGVGNEGMKFGANIRGVLKTPILTCPTKTDAFTVDNTNYGNGVLKYPVGLITSDEVFMAGISSSNTFNYLYTNNNYWLLSPSLKHNNGTADVLIMLTTNISTYGVYVSQGIRPVLSLKSSTIVSGTGQWNDPYIVE